jgi:hypothetical protein
MFVVERSGHMTIAIRKYAALTEILLPLAEEFEAGNPS